MKRKKWTVSNRKKKGKKAHARRTRRVQPKYTLDQILDYYANFK